MQPENPQQLNGNQTPPQPPQPPQPPVSQQSPIPQAPMQQPGLNASTPPSSFPAPAPAPTNQPNYNYAQPHNLTTKSSSKGIIIGVIAAIVSVLALIIGAYFVIVQNGPGAKSKKASNEFMTAMLKGDTSTALAYTDGSDDSKKFLDSMSKGVKGNSYKLIEHTNQASKWYYLYNLEGSNNKMARTELEQDNGKWLISGFYSGSNLALVATKSAEGDKPEPNQPVETPEVAKTTSGVCLTDSDVAPLTGGEAFGTDLFEGGRKYVGDTFFFNPDSTEYDFGDVTNDRIQKVADWYKNNSTKKFTINLKGKVYESSTTQQGLKLSNQRAEKIKSDLVSRGVSADVIVIDEPQKSSATYGDGSERNVDLSILSPATCDSGSNR